MQTEHYLNGMFVQEYDQLLIGNSRRHEDSSGRLKINDGSHSLHPPAARQ